MEARLAANRAFVKNLVREIRGDYTSDDDDDEGWVTYSDGTSDSDTDVGRAPPIMPRRGVRYPCQLCGDALAAGNHFVDNIIFCRPDGRTELKPLQWALDSDLYDATRNDVLCVCRDHDKSELPAPWGDGAELRDVSAAEQDAAVSSVGSVCKCGSRMCLCESDSDSDGNSWCDY